MNKETKRAVVLYYICILQYHCWNINTKYINNAIIWFNCHLKPLPDTQTLRPL